MLSKEQETQIKQQILQQIDSSFPEDKKAEAKAQLEAMDSEQLEQFVQQNNAAQSNSNGAGAAGTSTEQQCVFCAIISGDINSYKLEENASAVAILEINPISEGHTIIIPKKHSEKIPASAQKLAEKVSKLLKTKLKPKDILISPAILFGHAIINVLPVYKDETLESEKHKASPDELEASLKKILQEEKKPIKKPKPKKIKEKLWLPKRIP
jgi:histidine triad (HIT) family protein